MTIAEAHSAGMFDVAPSVTEGRTSPFPSGAGAPRREALGRHPVLRALPAALQEAVAHEGRMVRQAIGDRTTAGSSLGFVIDGGLAGYDEGNLACVEVLGSGATLGWEAALTERPSGQQLLALLETSWLAIPAALPARVMGAPWVERMFARHALDRLRRMQRLSACHIVHPVSARTATLIQQLATSAMSDEVRTTQAALASALGVQRTSVNAAIKALETAGALRVRRGGLRIVCPEALTSAACGCS